MELVITGTALEGVGTAAAMELVVAITGDEGVSTGAAQDVVVASAAGDGVIVGATIEAPERAPTIGQRSDEAAARLPRVVL